MALVETVHHDPRWNGPEHSNWTCPLLAGYLAQQTGSALSAERVRVLLHQHGIRLKQPMPVVHSHEVVEYSLVMAFISIVAIAAMKHLGHDISKNFDVVANSLHVTDKSK